MQKDNRSIGGHCPKIPSSPVDQENLRNDLAKTGVMPRFQDAATPLETLIVRTMDSLYEFFHFNGYMVGRSEWEEKTIDQALRRYHGWVYAFYGPDDFPLYVGETGRTFVDRFGEHAKDEQMWWPEWTRVKVLPCPTQTIRKVLESLIGLAGGYQGNKLQPAGGDNIFDDVTLSLLLLGNDNDREPAFPPPMG
jgi:hypothetical protein